MRRTVRLLAACATLAVGGCSHTKTTKSEPSTAAHTEGAPARHATVHGTAGTPVADTPEGLVAPGGIQKIQQRLRQRGLLAEHETGHLDGATRQALRRLQHDDGLPETGLPDEETMRKLGLDPDKLIRHAPSDEVKKAGDHPPR